jgi:hypothetical protein
VPEKRTTTVSGRRCGWLRRLRRRRGCVVAGAGWWVKPGEGRHAVRVDRVRGVVRSASTRGRVRRDGAGVDRRGRTGCGPGRWVRPGRGEPMRDARPGAVSTERLFLKNKVATLVT